MASYQREFMLSPFKVIWLAVLKILTNQRKFRANLCLYLVLGPDFLLSLNTKQCKVSIGMQAVLGNLWPDLNRGLPL